MSRRALALALAAFLAAAAPAAANPVVAGPATPDELAVIAIGGSGLPLGQSKTDHVALHRLSTADGAYKGRVQFPTDTLTKSNQPAGQAVRAAALRRSADGRFLTFSAIRAAAGLTYQEGTNGTAVTVKADGTWTDQRLGSGFMTSIAHSPAGIVTVDGTRKWIGVTHNAKPIATLAEGDTVMTQVSGFPTSTPGPTSIDLVDGSLVTTNTSGVHRLPGGLPTALDTTTPPQLFISAPGALDAVFVDTDGTAGADTAYVVRFGRGLWKFALDNGTWKPRGSVSGDYNYVAARAVSGAVELYATTYNTAKLVKLVDTAEIGADFKSTGATTLAYAPGTARFTGLAFAPGSGFPADGTPYPATPPVITASATAVDTHIGAAPKASVDLEVFDPNTTDVTVTATSANQAILPNANITITGTGSKRTATLNPITTGSTAVTFTARSDDETATVTVSLATTAAAPYPGSHYYSGAVDLSAAVDVGGDHFLGVSDEVNTIHLYKKGVSGRPLASWSDGFPGGETDFEGVTRFGDMLVWSGSHGNNRSGSARPERRFLAFQKITGSGDKVDLEWSHSYTGLWNQWKAWDAANGHGLGANYLKFNTATVAGLLPNAPNGFNVEGLTMAPGSSSVAWFGMRAPTITGADGIERALILPVTNIDKLTSESVNAQFGAPIFLDLGGRSIRDINKNARDEYLITAGTGDTDDSLKNWALYTWDGNPAHDPKFVNELPTDEGRIGAWEGIAEVPNPLVAGAKTLLLADSGDTGLGKSYGQYVTIGEPVAAPAVTTGVTATAKPGELAVNWDATPGATAYYVTVKLPNGQHALGSPAIVTGTSASFVGLTAGTEHTVTVRAQNVASRSAAGTVLKATPTQGARTATTVSLEWVGTKVGMETHKLIATVSDPNAQGKVEFLNGTTILQDSFASEPVPGCECFQTRRAFPVVNGKAEIDLTNRFSGGAVNFSARFTTANAENFLSSATTTPITGLVEYKPRVPFVEIVSITGDRVAGAPQTIKLKLRGAKPSVLYPGQRLFAQMRTRVNNAAAVTLFADTAGSSSAYFDENGEATFVTTALAAGKHRVSAEVPNFNAGYTPVLTSEVPVELAPAGSPAAAAPALKTPYVHVTVSGPRIVSQALTFTARVSDPTLAGTVQFGFGNGTAIGTPVPVVNGVATLTTTLTTNLRQIHARFEPTADRDTTISAVSLAVPLLRDTVQLPFPPATTTATTLTVAGDDRVGAARTATVKIVPTSAGQLPERDVFGSVELFDGDVSLGLVPVIAGEATIDVSGLPAGVHSLVAKYVPSDETRSSVSQSAAVSVPVAVETDVEAGAGGSVPATLSLTLGTPATFGAFTPGVEREYTASTKATVISTAGDAALSVSEPGHLTNSAFSLPQPLRVELGRSSWTGPVSNEDVPVTFKQLIGANDALRTGAYSQTLTFTLSTTTP
ncbi:DUF3616 domain-containing protein [Solirubrobacter phytolaccae]|uniref:DUF3616 domain-containing protein n=1 Tax=Solirubrobacter phytolaccae TaxID=1404360 RepID=A0A9X3SDL2_9ACTN|nr:DUF3616 domain-containing protein [Solirubrobacter phytolaccae]MDA0183800.1 DUF3616 domain-containing protein [Solirubrobacter phytolaccae]